VVIFLAECAELAQRRTASPAERDHSPLSVGVRAAPALWAAATGAGLLRSRNVVTTRKGVAVVLVLLAG